MPDLLVFVPVFRLAPETVNAVMQLQWAGGRIDRLFGEDLLTPPGPANHLGQYQLAWALAQQYDALMTVESDIVPPADAALRLWKCLANADVALGLYVFRSAERVNACPPGPSVGQGYTLEQMRDLWGRVIPVSGVGFGCAMFAPRALEIPLHNKPGTYCDLPWFQDVLRAGLRVVCDTGVVCGHVWEGEILYPSPKGVVRMEAAEEARTLPKAVRVRMKVAVASVYGSPAPGDEMVIPLHDALSWQAAGYCEILEGERVRDCQSAEGVPQHQRGRGRRAAGAAGKSGDSGD